MNLKERNQKVRKFFNEKIDTYDDVHNMFMNTKNEIGNNLDKDSKRILDLGGGTGLELIHIFELFPNIQVTVIDITENMLEKLKERDFSKNVTTICGDFFEVEFDRDYDAVISTSALHHFKYQEKKELYKKIFNCLKNNGQFINSDLIAPTEEIQNEQLDKLDNKYDDYKHIDIPITIENEIKLLNEVGFKDITKQKVDVEDYCLIKAKKRI